MSPGREHSIVVNLSAIVLNEFDKPAVYSRRGSAPFRSWIDENASLEDAEVTLVLSLDKRYFDPLPVALATKPLRLNLKKLHALKQSGFTVPKSAFEVLRASGDGAPFSFGTETFKVRTRAAGVAPVVISVWADGRPIDEISAALCIVTSPGDPCRATGSPETTLRGVDLNVTRRYPDAALHVMDATTQLVAVFRCNSCGWKANEYKTWNIAQTVESLSKRITENLDLLAPAFAPDDFKPAFDSVGANLANLLFPPADADASAAISTLQKLTNDGREASTKNTAPPSFFVRLLPSQPALVLTPLNLLRPDPAKKSELVGQYVNVSIPLEYQSYVTPPACLSEWRLFVPPDDSARNGLGAVLTARAAFAEWIGRFSGTCRTCVETDETKFEDWLRNADDKQSLGLIILSHHEKDNTLYFADSGQPSVHATAIARKFAAPSAVVLAACGTGKPGASEFIRTFNRLGVDAVIATHTTVNARMAGTFLTLLMNQLRSHANDPAYGLGRARFDAVRTLAATADENGTPYGHAALSFLLAGNGALRGCPPESSSQTHPVAQPTSRRP